MRGEGRGMGGMAKALGLRGCKRWDTSARETTKRMRDGSLYHHGRWFTNSQIISLLWDSRLA